MTWTWWHCSIAIQVVLWMACALYSLLLHRLLDGRKLAALLVMAAGFLCLAVSRATIFLMVIDIQLRNSSLVVFQGLLSILAAILLFSAASMVARGVRRRADQPGGVDDLRAMLKEIRR